MYRQKGEEWGAGEKPNLNLISLNFFSVALQILWQNSIISRQLKLGMFGGHFRIMGFLGFFSEIIILFVCILVHAGAQCLGFGLHHAYEA